MSQQLTSLIEQWIAQYGLQQYEQGPTLFYKQYDQHGTLQYHLSVEFYPEGTSFDEEEELNPNGTAIFDYNLTKNMMESIIFVQSQSFSTAHPFSTQSVQEVAQWIEMETGYTYGEHFVAVDTVDHGYRFEGFINGYAISPAANIEVEFDDEGKLTSYGRRHMDFLDDLVPEAPFSMTVEQFAQTLQGQVSLIHYPVEETEELIPLYILDDVLLTAKGQLQHMLEFFSIPVDAPLYWETPLPNTIERQPIDEIRNFVSAEEAFHASQVAEKAYVAPNEIENIKEAVTDALSMLHPADSGQWILKIIQPTPSAIEVFCEPVKQNNHLISRKIIFFLDRHSLSVLNYLDNQELLMIFDHFKAAETVTITKEEAFKRLLPEITCTPTYRFDDKHQHYELCGQFDTSFAVHGVTGELVSLHEL